MCFSAAMMLAGGRIELVSASHEMSARSRHGSVETSLTRYRLLLPLTSPSLPNRVAILMVCWVHGHVNATEGPQGASSARTARRRHAAS